MAGTPVHRHAIVSISPQVSSQIYAAVAPDFHHVNVMSTWTRAYRQSIMVQAGRSLLTCGAIETYERAFIMTSGDFDVNSLASYLHLTPAQIMRMADRNKLPGRKVAGQWRFHEAEIHHWFEEQIGVSDDYELARVEGVLQRSAPEQEDVCIADMLPIEAIAVPLLANTQTSVVAKMVDRAAETGWLWDPVKMVDAVRARESLHTTALDNGMALLHPRRPQPNILAKSFLALGRTGRGIPFGGSRGSLTDIFFLILSTDEQGHLRTLARLSRLITDPDLVQAMHDAQNATELRQAIVHREVEQFG